MLSCCNNDPNNPQLVALNARNGTIRWKNYYSPALASSPSIVSPAKGNEVLFNECIYGTNGGTTCAIDGNSGALLWQSTDGEFDGSVPPTVTHGTVYEVCGYNDMCIYTPQ